MHVAVSGGAVPGAKKEEKNQQMSLFAAPTSPLAQTTAQCPSGCREPGRGSFPPGVGHQPTTGQT